MCIHVNPSHRVRTLLDFLNWSMQACLWLVLWFIPSPLT
jgi:hypothetical protein